MKFYSTFIRTTLPVTLGLLAFGIGLDCLATDTINYDQDVRPILSDKCFTCLRFGKRPTKQDSVAVKPMDSECWEAIMIDFEGPSSPADKHGNIYTLTYICVLCHGVLIEPARIYFIQKSAEPSPVASSEAALCP